MQIELKAAKKTAEKGKDKKGKNKEDNDKEDKGSTKASKKSAKAKAKRKASDPATSSKANSKRAKAATPAVASHTAATDLTSSTLTTSGDQALPNQSSEEADHVPTQASSVQHNTPAARATAAQDSKFEVAKHSQWLIVPYWSRGTVGLKSKADKKQYYSCAVRGVI
jgi:hypothetical protein